MAKKLKDLKGSGGLIKVGGKMPETLKKLGITAEQLLKLQAQNKKKKKNKKMTIA